MDKEFNENSRLPTLQILFFIKNIIYSKKIMQRRTSTILQQLEQSFLFSDKFVFEDKIVEDIFIFVDFVFEFIEESISKDIQKIIY